jgi:hypothetical protein
MDAVGILGYVLAYLLVAIPFWKILAKTGNSKIWVVVLIVPFIGLFVLWFVLAVSRWSPSRHSPELAGENL